MEQNDGPSWWMFDRSPEVQRTPLQILARGLRLTHHARERMDSRNISVEEVCAVLDCGVVRRYSGELIYAAGGLQSRLPRPNTAKHPGIAELRVVCSSDGRIRTVYKDRDLGVMKPRINGGRS